MAHVQVATINIYYYIQTNFMIFSLLVLHWSFLTVFSSIV